MIRRVLSIANPVAAAARPAYEFISEITTGMSAPPMGNTSRMPITSYSATMTQKAGTWLGSISSHANAPIAVRNRMALTPFCPG